MSATIPLSYWPARRMRPLGPISTTKVRRVPGNRHSQRNSFKREGCFFHCPPVAAVAEPAAAVADCFVKQPRINDGSERQAAGAALGKPCCCPPLERNAEELRLTLTCVESPRGRGHAPVAFGLQAAMRAIRPLMAVSWLCVALLLLLRSTPAGAIVDLTLYGGAFDSSSIIAYAEV